MIDFWRRTWQSQAFDFSLKVNCTESFRWQYGLRIQQWPHLYRW